MEQKISAAIQLLPIGENEKFYEIIHKAIEIIKTITDDYVVCPFETAVNCSWQQLFDIQYKIGKLLAENNTKGIINIKILQTTEPYYRIDLENYCHK